MDIRPFRSEIGAFALPLGRTQPRCAWTSHMPELPRQGMGYGCAARSRSLEGAGIASLSDLRRKRTGIPAENFRREPCRDAVERANDKITSRGWVRGFGLEQLGESVGGMEAGCALLQPLADILNRLDT
jgi:hypothetical protein